MKKFQKILPLTLLFTPVFAFAQLTSTTRLIAQVGTLVDVVTVIVAGLALLTFFWGLVKFISKAGDEGAHEEGRRIMIWGTLALFAMVSVWGLVHLVQNELLPGGDFGNPQIPTFRP